VIIITQSDVKGEGESGFIFTWSTHLFSSAHVIFCRNYLNDSANRVTIALRKLRRMNYRLVLYVQGYCWLIGLSDWPLDRL